MDNTNNILTKFSLLFTQRTRLTLLMFFATVILGFLVYTNLINREGFPEVEIPYAQIEVSYAVSDPEKVNKEVTNPIEMALSDIKEIENIQSITIPDGTFIIAEFSEGTTTEEGAALLSEKVKNVTLPANVSVSVNSIEATKFYGKYDMVLTLGSREASLTENQNKASELSQELLKLTNVVDSEVIKVLDEEVNPENSETYLDQNSFNRVGYKNEAGQLIFENGISIGLIRKSSLKDTIQFSDEVTEKINDLKEENFFEERYEVFYTGDFSKQIQENISSLEENARDGIIGVMIVLFLFVGWRASIVTAIFIPVVMAATFIALYIAGYSLNVISLFALILALGLFVDDGIVVVEAIDYQKKQGLKGIVAVKKAINMIGFPDLTGTLTTTIVFGPMLFIGGILGKFIFQLPVTVIIALLLSIVIALSFLPYFSNILISDKSSETKGVFKTLTAIIDFPVRVVMFVRSYVVKFVKFYLSYPLITIFVIIPVTFIFIGLGASFSSKLKFAVFPSTKDSNEIAITIDYPDFKDLENTQRLTISDAENIAKQVESILTEKYEEYIEEVEYFEANERAAQIEILLTDMKERDIKSPEIVDGLNEEFKKLQNADVKAGLVSVGPPTTEFPFAMQVYANDQEILLRSAEEIENYIKNLSLENDIFVTETKVDGLFTYSKLNNRRYVEIKAKISDENNTGAVLEIQDKVKEKFTESEISKLGLESDALGFDLGQESENIDSFNQAIFALFASLFLMYALLVIQFNSFTQPLLIFIAIPFTVPGLFPGLYITDNAISFFVMLGLIGLIGIVVNNTIMLVDFANQAREEGRGIRDSILYAIQMRFRPIVTTSTTTVAGLLPLALNDPFWEGLGFTIIFGLLSSAFLVIFAFPAFYTIVEYLRSVRDGVSQSFRQKSMEPIAKKFKYSVKQCFIHL